MNRAQRRAAPPEPHLLQPILDRVNAWGRSVLEAAAAGEWNRVGELKAEMCAATGWSPETLIAVLRASDADLLALLGATTWSPSDACS